MKKPVKIALGCLATGGLIFAVFLVGFLHWANGFDASKEDPRELYARFIQKEIPASVKIDHVSGGGAPIGGTGIWFYFEIGSKDLDNLISSNQLQKTEDRPFSYNEYLEGMKHPEFYSGSATNLYRVGMAADRETGKVLYFVYCL